MKSAFLVLFLFLTSCSSTAYNVEEFPEKKTRTVFFGTARLEGSGYEMRVMFDTLDTKRMGLMVKRDWRSVILPSIAWVDPNGVRVLDAPFYNVFWDYVCSGLHFQFAGTDFSETYNEAYFIRQEQITGQTIDMVIGYDDARRLFSKDFQPYWSEMVGSDGRSLLEYHTDMKMTVPYDWGMGDETDKLSYYLLNR